MAEPPFISVLIPCYNEKKYIPALIENLRGQNYPANRSEIIFADGMSTDGTKELLEEYAKESPQIAVIDNPDRYVPTGLNAALRA
ncbi:MAG: glycosyltransferase, partial [Planctomycetaceae bacterium]|nr:glycosyltransferase [Planctomycetaceae bacterium]